MTQPALIPTPAPPPGSRTLPDGQARLEEIAVSPLEERAAQLQTLRDELQRALAHS